jgi:hypothetical protein
MSLYRLTVRNGTLIREKRKLLRWWIWSFNRCEEDHINRMKNALQKLRAEQAKLMKMLPEHEDRLSKVKEVLAADGNVGRPYRDSWTTRKDPVRLDMDVKKPKKPDKKCKPEPATLARLVVDASK